MRVKALIFAAIMFLVLNAASVTEAAARSLDDYGPINLAEEYKKAKQQADQKGQNPNVNQGNPNFSNGNISNEARITSMLTYLTNNKWMITRSMLFGFTNIEETKKELGDVHGFRMVMQDKAGAISPVDMLFFPSIIVKQTQGLSGIVAESMTGKPYAEQVKEVVDSVFDIPYMDANGDETLYERVRTIGYILLIVFFIGRMAFILIKNVTTDDRHDEQYGMALEIREVMTYFVILALLMTYTPTIMKFIMWFSDLFRDILMGFNTKDGIGDIMESYAILSYIKGKIVGLQTEFSVWNFLVSPGDWLRGVVAWFCYVLCSGVLFIIVILADAMIGITAILTPLILAISILPMSASWRVNYYHSLFKFSLYIPLAGLYAIVMCYIHTMIPNISFMPYVCISYAFFWAASKIPTMAEHMSGTVFAPESSKLGGSIAHTPSKLARYGASKIGGNNPR